MSSAPCQEKVYVDLDPAFTQIWAEVYKSDMHLDFHDTFVSIGRHLGAKDCRAPLAGRNWLPVGVPVVLDYFTNPKPDTPATTWTTFTHWYGYPQVEYHGEWYGNKSEEFAKLVDLPQQDERETRDRHQSPSRGRSPPPFSPPAAGASSMRAP